MVDAAQSAGVVPDRPEETPIDLLAFPGHKALYGRPARRPLRRPEANPLAWREGGTGGDSSSETNPRNSPTSSKAARQAPESPASPPALAWVAEARVAVNRKHEVDLLQKVVDWTEAPKAGASPAAGSRRPTSGRSPDRAEG